MSENIENLKSVLKIRIFADTTQTSLWVNYSVQEMILRNPQALYILRILEKFENSLKMHFFIREMGANFNSFQRNSTSAQKLPLT